MWIATKFGFYSMANKPAEQFPEYESVIHVRGRGRDDMRRLIDLMAGLKLKITPEISYREEVDYNYRIFVHPDDLPRVLFRLGKNLDYQSFKGMVSESDHQKHKLGAYCSFWSDMLSAFGIDPMSKYV
jgi:hypothetical protein